MADNDLTFESTTDTPEQMREGMGLPAESATTTVVEAGAPDTADLAADPAPVAATDVTTTDTPAEPVVAKPTRAKDPVTGKFIATPKADPVAEERAQRVVAETERDALKRRVEELAAGAPKPAPVAPAPVVPAIDPDTYQDPGVAAKFAAARTALGQEPRQEDFDTDNAYTDFRNAQRAYDRKLAVLDAREADAHYNAGVSARTTAQAGAAAARQVFDTYEQRTVATKARHGDYDAVMEAGKNIPFTGAHRADVQRAIVEMEDGPEVVYHLAKNPELIQKIMSQPSVYLALAELGRVASVATAAVSAATAPAGATQTGPTTIVATTKPVSRAPEPQGTVLGSGPGLVTTDLSKVTTQAEYNRIRNAQERAKFGR
jgi:hypothetical protein